MSDLTEKYQANCPAFWRPVIRAIAVRVGGPGASDGVGIRAALAFAIEHAEEIRGSDVLNGRSAPKAPAKAPAKAKAKAPAPAPAKAPAKAKAKAPAKKPAKKGGA